MAQKFGGLLATAKRILDVTLRFDTPQTLTQTQLAQAAANLGLTGARQAGEIAYFAMPSTPTGWLQCNGAAVSRTVYAALFAAIGTTWGAGDGSTTFNVPDLRGAFIRGWDNGRGLDTASGRGFATYQGDQFGSHNHGAGASTSVWPNSGTFLSYVGTGNGNSGLNNATYVLGEGISASTSVSVYGNGGAETNPRNYALLPCVKY